LRRNDNSAVSGNNYRCGGHFGESETMTRKEIEGKKKGLADILREENTEVRLKKLQELAREVGASVTRIEKVETQKDIHGYIHSKPSNEITEMEIVHNIQVALQTETMIDMCKTASRNFIIAMVASITAFLSMIAAWVAALLRH